MRFSLFLLLAPLLLLCRAGAAPARIQWEPGTPRLLLDGQPLLEVVSSPRYEGSLWTVRDGRLTWDRRAQADQIAVANTEAARELTYSGEVRVLEDDVAGLVLRAAPQGAPCYAVLLGAESRLVRLVYLPWPGRDLWTAPFPVERGRSYRLTVRCDDTSAGTRLRMEVDGKPVGEFTDDRYRPPGTRVGVMTNNSRAQFDALEVTGPGGLHWRRTFEQSGLEEFATPSVPLAVTRTRNTLTLSGQLPASGSGLGALAQFCHGISDARHVWVNHVTPEPGYVIGDHSLRSPAVILADDRSALVLVPDVDDLRALQQAGLRTWLDYDHPKRALTVAVGSYRVGGFHVGYQPASLEYRGQPVRLRLHVLTSTRPADLANPYGMAARYAWERWGHAGYVRGSTQKAPFTTYSAYVTRWAFEPEPRGWGDTVWQSLRIDGRDVGAPAFIVDVAQHPSVPLEQRRWREQRSIWNQAWFSTQRCANGLLRYARQVGSRDLERRAELMTAFALAAPQKDGLFPSVYTAGGGGYSLYKNSPGWEKGRWTNSDRRPRGVSGDAVHLLDAAFTARLLLEWSRIPDAPRAAEARLYVDRFLKRLVRLQLPSGAFPGWVEPDGRVPAALREGPESAMAVTLLLEAYRDDRSRTDLREAALKGLRYLRDGPVREGRWEDFETYYSCSGFWGDRIGQRIERTGVYKSNTFSPFWCAEAFLAAHRALGGDEWLALGRRCLDELSLYQQVWDPPTIPAPCHGGFGVMNADGEWNDARQSLFAPLYLEYARETGVPEYFERGVSALRASFAMLYCPENARVRAAYEATHRFFGPESYGFMMENIAHGGPGGNPIGPFTIFTWGNGAALVSAATVRDGYGQVYVDPRRRAAYGIDGCTAEVRGGSVTIHDPYHRDQIEVVYANGHRRIIAQKAGKGTAPLR